MKTAVITGASAGIGRASAQSFLERGYRVYNLSRRPSALEGVLDLRCDLASAARIDQAVQAMAADLEQADSLCLVHNACQMRKDRADDCLSDDLAAVLQTNVVAVNHLNQSLIPLMKPGSSILYIGSTLSEKAVAGAFSYVVSKHALAGMMRATCQDLAGRAIHTACICPGFTDTEMLRGHVGHDETVLQAIAAMNGIGRLIEPEEIAGLIGWAAENPVINGAVLHANLGQKES